MIEHKLYWPRSSLKIKEATDLLAAKRRIEELGTPAGERRLKGRRTVADVQRWPNLFIVGAVKAGTTSLYRYLQQHPDVYMSPVKEPNFFLGEDPGGGQRYLGDEDSYLKLFEGATTETVLGEASVLYLFKRGTAERIQRVVPEAKIIISLRDPVDRAYSHYLMDVRDRVQNHPFLEALRLDLDSPTKRRETNHLYVDLGRYCEQVGRYLEVFAENVCILFFEEFVSDTRTHLREVFRILEVDPAYADIVQLGKHKTYAGFRGRSSEALYRHIRVKALARMLLSSSMRARIRGVFFTDEKPPMDPRALECLEELYDSEAKCLERLLGREVPWSPERRRMRSGRPGSVGGHRA